MLLDAGLSFLHFTFAFIFVGALSAEAFVLRLPVNGCVARLLWRLDWFGRASAIALLLAGLARLNFGAKDWDYYQAQPFFWAKMAAFALIGVISIAPSLAYFRWSRAANMYAGFAVAEAEVKKTRRWVMIELHMLALLLAFAALMARGVGG
jgi:putative membrane protein